MSNVETNFRTASVGGFHKKDVISYIEAMEQEYRTKLGTLEKIVAAAQSARGELEQRLQQLEADQGRVAGENQRLKALTAGLQEQLNTKAQELQQALEEMELLRGGSGAVDALQVQLLQATQEIELLQRREVELRKALEEQRAGAGLQSQAELDRLREELAQQRELVSALQQENEALRLKVEQLLESGGGSSVSQELLMDLQTQLEKRNRQMIQMNTELELMRDKCRNYEKTVSALEDVQAKAEQIEAQAREKAGRLVAAAAQESGKMKADLDQWLSEIEESYQRIKKDAEDKVTQAYEELEKAKAAMDRLTREQEDELLGRTPLSVITPRFGDAKNA